MGTNFLHSRNSRSFFYIRVENTLSGSTYQFSVPLLHVELAKGEVGLAEVVEFEAGGVTDGCEEVAECGGG